MENVDNRGANLLRAKGVEDFDDETQKLEGWKIELQYCNGNSSQRVKKPSGGQRRRKDEVMK